MSATCWTRGSCPGGTRRNVEAVRARAGVAGDEETLTLLADAQTSGGLLLACPPDAVGGLCDDLVDGGDVAAVIGRLERAASGTIRLG